MGLNGDEGGVSGSGSTTVTRNLLTTGEMGDEEDPGEFVSDTRDTRNRFRDGLGMGLEDGLGIGLGAGLRSRPVLRGSASRPRASTAVRIIIVSQVSEIFREKLEVRWFSSSAINTFASLI